MTSSPAITHFLAHPVSLETPSTSKATPTFIDTICDSEKTDTDLPSRTASKTDDISVVDIVSVSVPLGERGMKKYLLNEEMTKSEII